MCSSCKRRTMNPAIPAETLKELGLNQNSSAVRRMTLRLNQNELKLALNKSSSESTTSSNSSSGCSSMSAAARQQQPLRLATGITRTSGQQQVAANDTLALINLKRAQERTGPAAVSGAPLSGPIEEPQLPPPPQKQQQHQRLVQYSYSVAASIQEKHRQQQRQRHQQQASPTSRRNSNYLAGGGELTQPQAAGTSSSSSASAVAAAEVMRLAAQKTLSQPARGANQSHQQHHQQHQREPPHTVPATPPAVEGSSRQGASMGGGGGQPTGVSPGGLFHEQLRRASVSIGGQQAKTLSSQKIAGSWQQQQQTAAKVQRKFSMATVGDGAAAINLQRAGQEQLTRTILDHRNSLAYQHQHQQAFAMSKVQQQQPLCFQMQQPQTLVTASSERSLGSPGQSRRNSQQMQLQSQQQQQQVALIPVPSEQQMHLRRLSDQSNLVRRSSIIAETLDGLAIARNRSHSNIDTVACSEYYYAQQQQQQSMFTGHGQLQQQAYNYSDENMARHQQQLLNTAAHHYEQRRLSDQWDQRQHSMGESAQQQHQLSSIITSCSQKGGAARRQNSSDEPGGGGLDGAHSDSSSDFEEGIDGAPLESTSGQPLSIPSVSVSEFSGHRRGSLMAAQLQQQQQQQQQFQLQQAQDQITPMQINVAIEQVIQQQQQQEGQLLQAGYLLPRRGSSGRVLPRIPGEQSRSLLDLPHNQQNNGLSNAANGCNAAARDSTTLGGSTTMMDANNQTLGLPNSSPTIRRASAPEGQNIKIVVDDLGDGALGKAATRSSGRGAQGELYERLVVYRDDSLDPASNNVGRGFGLQVMGGKISEFDGRLHAFVAWVLQGGPADKVGLRPGDQIIEWDGKCLLDMSYEQVAELIESSANIAELLVKPAHRLEPQASNYVRSQRRLSQQTERDLRRIQQTAAESCFATTNGSSTPPGGLNSRQQQRRACSQEVAAGSSWSGTAAARRSGTGRRLPQIPGVPAAAGSQQLSQTGCAVNSAGDTNPNAATMGVPHFATVRHASTGQLEDTGGFQEIASMSQQQAQLAGSGTVFQHLGAHHEQQSRSASELSGGNLPFSLSEQQQAYNLRLSQQQQRINQQHHSDSHWNFAYAASSSNSVNRAHHFGGYNFGGQLNVNGCRPSAEVCGLIGLQVSVDERAKQLEISVLSAINIERNTSLDHYVRIRILPESQRFKACTTQPSADMNWKETFIFQNFPTHELHKMALEIGIWVQDDSQRLSTQMAQPICETLIPIQSARERNTDFWPLRPPPTSPQTRRRSLNDLIGK